MGSLFRRWRKTRSLVGGIGLALSWHEISPVYSVTFGVHSTTPSLTERNKAHAGLVKPWPSRKNPFREAGALHDFHDCPRRECEAYLLYAFWMQHDVEGGKVDDAELAMR